MQKPHKNIFLLTSWRFKESAKALLLWLFAKQITKRVNTRKMFRWRIAIGTPEASSRRQPQIARKVELAAWGGQGGAAALLCRTKPKPRRGAGLVSAVLSKVITPCLVFYAVFKE